MSRERCVDEPDRAGRGGVAAEGPDEQDRRVREPELPGFDRAVECEQGQPLGVAAAGGASVDQDLDPGEDRRGEQLVLEGGLRSSQDPVRVRDHQRQSPARLQVDRDRDQFFVRARCCQVDRSGPVARRRHDEDHRHLRVVVRFVGETPACVHHLRRPVAADAGEQGEVADTLARLRVAHDEHELLLVLGLRVRRREQRLVVGRRYLDGFRLVTAIVERGQRDPVRARGHVAESERRATGFALLAEEVEVEAGELHRIGRPLQGLEPDEGDRVFAARRADERALDVAGDPGRRDDDVAGHDVPGDQVEVEARDRPVVGGDQESMRTRGEPVERVSPLAVRARLAQRRIAGALAAAPDRDDARVHGLARLVRDASLDRGGAQLDDDVDDVGMDADGGLERRASPPQTPLVGDVDADPIAGRPDAHLVPSGLRVAEPEILLPVGGDEQQNG